MTPSKEFHALKNGRFAGLDHLRAFAIITVLFYHYRMFKHPDWLNDIMGFGWSGVDLFFVLSGYLIATPLFARMAADRPISLPEFFIKRVFRIIPAYLVVLAIYFLFPGFHEKEALPPLWKFLTFTQNFGFDIKNLGTFSHVWSLCVEEHFYLLFPLVLAAMIYAGAKKRGAQLLLGVLVFGFAARLLSWYLLIVPDMGNATFGITWYKHMYYPTYNRLDGLLAGIAIAALFVFRPGVKEKIAAHGNKVLVLGLLVLTGAWFLCDDQKSFYASIFRNQRKHAGRFPWYRQKTGAYHRARVTGTRSGTYHAACGAVECDGQGDDCERWLINVCVCSPAEITNRHHPLITQPRAASPAASPISAGAASGKALPPFYSASTPPARQRKDRAGT